MSIKKNYKELKTNLINVIEECKLENILLYLLIISLVSGFLFGLIEFIERSYATGYNLDVLSKVHGVIYSASWMADLSLIPGLIITIITGITIGLMYTAKRILKKYNQDTSSILIIPIIVISLLVTIAEIHFYFSIPKPEFTYYFLLSPPISMVIYYKFAITFALIVAAALSLKLEYKKDFSFIKSFLISFIGFSIIFCLLFYFMNAYFNTLSIWNNFYNNIFNLYNSSELAISAMLYIINFVFLYLFGIILILTLPRLWKYKLFKLIIILTPLSLYAFYYLFTMNYLVGQSFFVIPIGNIHYITGLISYLEFFALTIIVLYFAGFTPIKLIKFDRKYKWTLLITSIVILMLVSTYLKPDSNKLKAFDAKSSVIQNHLTQKWIDPIINKKAKRYYTLPSEQLCKQEKPVSKEYKDTKRPNIFLISVDALRTDYATNDKLAPNLNNFIKEAYFFKNNYSHATHTPASLSSISTSKYFTATAAANLNTLASILKNNGYNTKAFVGFNLANPKLVLNTTYNNNVELPTPITKDYTHLEMIEEYGNNTDSIISASAKKHINDYKGNKPLLQWLHLYQLHETPVIEVLKNFLNNNSFKNEYSRRLKNVDRVLGEYLNYLKSKDLYDNSLIVIFSDHGEEIKEHSSFFHTFSLYNELIKVPLIIKFPGQKEGVTIESSTSSLDLTPTILNYAGIDTNEYNFCGEDLNKTINGTLENRRLPISSLYRGFYYKNHNAKTISSSILMTTQPVKYMVNKLTSYAIVDKNSEWKLIYNLEPEYFELYNIKKDPAEKNNLADQNPDKLTELLNQLEKQLKISK